MLKIVKTSVVVGALALSNFAYADVSEALANICTIVQADDKGELRKKMRAVEADYRLKLGDYYSGISCSGNSLIRTAMLSNAVETGELLVKKMPKGDLEAPEADGKTLQAWVVENGLQDSPIAAVISARL
ncbi:DUF3718 domain-containing protein [Alteromonas sp. McT4-15]|jgi:hypothetical protein|uniref:DUF3718 domain-containing protein n=1 Tax=Alteromonas sp. McT4-15 TaxID=2881256 RepID=UPI0012E48471|nr:DUF3718 domain-containing protein [Alteromonas sp. McT4-15]MCB4437095.1 DUF3718 domain-containing protein [Alteromonas sp. McT4-15]GFD89541.1 hypothetical protein KUL152_17670 [Tenacibaculum sp. KUL152]